MKKIIFLISILIVFNSCKHQIVQKNISQASPISCENLKDGTTYGTTRINNGIEYYKDQKTGACFAILNSISSYGYVITSLTYVPDSVYQKAIK